MLKNFASGLVSSLLNAVLGLLVVPFYLKLLGAEAYGLIGFSATIQGVFVLLDLGLSQTVNREIARALAHGERTEAGRLLHALSCVYWGVGATLGAIVVAAAPFIVQRWIRLEHLDDASAVAAVRAMGLVAFARWPLSLYQGAAMGAERFTGVNGIAIVASLVLNLGGLAVLAWGVRSVTWLFGWHAIVGMLQVLALRALAWRGLDSPKRFLPDLAPIRSVAQFSGGLTAVTASAIVLSQLDKILLSRLLSMPDFGRYMLATTVARCLYLVVTPVFNVVFPRFSRLVASSDTDGLEHQYRFGTNALATALFPIALVIVLSSRALLTLWTRDDALAASTSSAVSVLVCGAALHGVMFFPYAAQLAFGLTELPLRINVLLVSISLPLTWALTSRYGMLGGAVSWLVVNATYVVFGAWLTHRRIMQSIGTRWLASDVGRPLGVALVLGCAAYPALVRASIGTIPSVAAACAVGAAGAAAGAAVSPHALWSAIVGALRGARGVGGQR